MQRQDNKILVNEQWYNLKYPNKINSNIIEVPESNPIIGVKGLHKRADGTLYCLKQDYTKGKNYIQTSEPKLCSTGFHFCLKIKDVFKYYDWTSSEQTVYHKVKAYGLVDVSSDKLSASSIEILDELAEDEMNLHKVRTFLDVIDKIMLSNPNVIIAGSLALMLQGWIPIRTYGDIDITLPYFSEFKGGEVIGSVGNSGTEALKMLLSNGIAFDLFLNAKNTWKIMIIDGKEYKVSEVKPIIDAKMRYYMTGSFKHGKDIKNIINKVNNLKDESINPFDAMTVSSMTPVRGDIFINNNFNLFPWKS